MFPKIQTLVFFCIFNQCLSQNFYLCRDPNGPDYCSMRCYPNNITSSGCNCDKPLPNRSLKNENLTEFRQLVVNTHNEFRNKIARGDEENFPPAANMRVMNYDLELEYLAGCFILSRFTNNFDTCTTASYCGSSPTGQNIVGHSKEKPNSDQKAIKAWYKTRLRIPKSKIPCLIKSFFMGSWSSFTQIVWAEMDRVGCARGSIPENPSQEYRDVMVCNYATYCVPCGCGSDWYKGWPVYQIGPKCSNCGGLKCNNQLGGPYDALCGEEKEIGSDLGGNKNCTRKIITCGEYETTEQGE